MNSIRPMIYSLNISKKNEGLLPKEVARQGCFYASIPSEKEFLSLSDSYQMGGLVLERKSSWHSCRQSLRRIKRNFVGLPVILIANSCMCRYAAEVFKIGVVRILRTPINEEEISNSLREVIINRKRAIDNRALEYQRIELFPRLTSREITVFNLVVKGFTNKEISQKLSIVVGTVEFHRSNIMKKLKSRTLSQLIEISRKNIYSW